MKRQHRTGCLLLSVCFFIYAVSPLSAVYQHNQVISQAVSAFNGIRLLVVELLLSPPAHEDDGDGTSSRVLLRKKRATLSSDKLKVSKRQIKKVIASNNIISSDAETTFPVVITEHDTPLREGIVLLHSGLSPPSV
ncbi:MAG: hypothetical protein HY786_06095 [Deltaproteobacteria bacterium]|nr:hypothetical protein [Deltaproteobacteria bacterium]